MQIHGMVSTTLVCWYVKLTKGTATGLWALKESTPITMIPNKAPIASFTWDTTVEGMPKILDTLSSGPGGVMVRFRFLSRSCRHADFDKVNQWVGTRNTWLSSVTPGPMRGVQNYSSLAANNNAFAYAILNDTIWEFGLRPNNKRWIPTGKVWP